MIVALTIANVDLLSHKPSFFRVTGNTIEKNVLHNAQNFLSSSQFTAKKLELANNSYSGSCIVDCPVWFRCHYLVTVGQTDR